MSLVQSKIDELIEGHNYFLKVLNELTNEQIHNTKITPEWTVKDIVAHLAAWNLFEAEAIDQIQMGKIPFFVEENVDVVNKIEVEKRRNRNFGEIKNEWLANFDRHIEKLKSLNDEIFVKDFGVRSPKGEVINIFWLYDYQYKDSEHEKGHAVEIEQSLEV